MAREDFASDRRTRQAVVMNLIIIGEAATRILESYPEFADQFPAVDWCRMRGMQNRIAHGYFAINLDTVGTQS